MHGRARILLRLCAEAPAEPAEAAPAAPAPVAAPKQPPVAWHFVSLCTLLFNTKGQHSPSPVISPSPIQAGSNVVQPRPKPPPHATVGPRPGADVSPPGVVLRQDYRQDLLVC